MRRFAIAPLAVSLFSAADGRGQTVLNFFDQPAAYPGLEAFVGDVAGYGDNESSTPNVTLDFSGLQLWDTGYADLTNVAYVDSGAGISRPPLGVATVTLTADPGFLVRLDSVDTAGYGGVDFDFDSVTVTGGDLAFALNNVAAPGGARHTIDFGGITGEQLVLTFNDADSLEQAGIDNLSFAQVPEPAAMAPTLLACGLGMLARRRRRLLRND